MLGVLKGETALTGLNSRACEPACCTTSRGILPGSLLPAGLCHHRSEVHHPGGRGGGTGGKGGVAGARGGAAWPSVTLAAVLPPCQRLWAPCSATLAGSSPLRQWSLPLPPRVQPWKEQLSTIVPTLRPETGNPDGLASDPAIIGGEAPAWPAGGAARGYHPIGAGDAALHAAWRGKPRRCTRSWPLGRPTWLGVVKPGGSSHEPETSHPPAHSPTHPVPHLPALVMGEALPPPGSESHAPAQNK